MAQKTHVRIETASKSIQLSWTLYGVAIFDDLFAGFLCLFQPYQKPINRAVIQIFSVWLDNLSDKLHSFRDVLNVILVFVHGQPKILTQPPVGTFSQIQDEFFVIGDHYPIIYKSHISSTTPTTLRKHPLVKEWQIKVSQ